MSGGHLSLQQQSQKTLCSCSQSWRPLVLPRELLACPGHLQLYLTARPEVLQPTWLHARKGGLREAGSSQPCSLGTHPTACSQSTPNAHGRHSAACRAQQGPSSLKHASVMMEEVMRMALHCGLLFFLVNGAVVSVPAQGNLNIRSSSAWRSSSVHFPREQPNKQASCGRGRNSELVEAGAWQNKLYVTQRARKEATGAVWLQPRGYSGAGKGIKPGIFPAPCFFIWGHAKDGPAPDVKIAFLWRRYWTFTTGLGSLMSFSLSSEPLFLSGCDICFWTHLS